MRKCEGYMFSVGHCGQDCVVVTPIGVADVHKGEEMWTE